MPGVARLTEATSNVGCGVCADAVTTRLAMTTHGQIHCRLVMWTPFPGDYAQSYARELERVTRSSVWRQHPRVPRDFPQVTVRILEIPGVAAPESVGSWLHDRRAGVARLIHDRIDFVSGRDVVAKCEVGRTRAADLESRVMSEACARPDRQLQAALQIEEGDSPVLEFPADNAVGLEAKTVAIEAKRPLQVVNAERDEGHSRFHESFSV